VKLRYQLTTAFLFLAVLPLSAITLYSYRSSTLAVRKAGEMESGRIAEQMENRMTSVTTDLSQRIDQLRDLRLPEEHAPPGEPSPAAEYAGRLLSTLGSAATYVDSLEITGLEHPEAGGLRSPPPSKDPPRASDPPTPPSPFPVVVELPRILGRIGEEVARSATVEGDEKLAEGAREIERVLRELTQGIDQGAREAAKAWRIQIKPVPERKQPRKEGRGVPEEKQPKLAREFATELRLGDRPVGRLKAHVSSGRLVEEILSRTSVEEGEIPFALDASGKLYTPDPRDLATLEACRLVPSAEHPASKPDESWVVVTRQDPSTGLVFGLAHPVGDSLREIRRTSVRNMIYGMGLSLLALVGILPLSRSMTRNLADVTHGAGRLAAGDLGAQVPVRSTDEFGKLARAFNQMAGRLKENQERLVQQERLRKELEMCRKIQNELLPRAPMRSRFAEVQGVSIPARELGGDFFNYFDLPGGEIALLMGDVSGKGVPAALLMANLQATLRARLPVERDLSTFVSRLDQEVEQGTAVQLYLTLFLGILDAAQGELRYINAGHPSPFVVRTTGKLDRLDPTGRPVGLFSGAGYEERRVPLGTGDGLFLYTDGLVDAENPAGESFGQDRLASLLSRGTGEGADALLARVEAALLAFRGGVEAPDDAAMMVLRMADGRG